MEVSSATVQSAVCSPSPLRRAGNAEGKYDLKRWGQGGEESADRRFLQASGEPILCSDLPSSGERGGGQGGDRYTGRLAARARHGGAGGADGPESLCQWENRRHIIIDVQIGAPALTFCRAMEEAREKFLAPEGTSDNWHPRTAAEEGWGPKKVHPLREAPRE